jgi:NADPH-dependent glutamate synthase beta subunit-like oxidoreductase
MNCQGYVHLLAQGKEEEAAKEIRKDLPFAGIVGRVCTRPCETSCERKKIDGQPVHIRALKRYLADSKPDICQEIRSANKKSDKRVAIVGSGPAGLMAAHELAVFGHNVTVFDSASEPGGMLRWAIPEFRLPGKEIDNAIKMLEKMHVIFEKGRTLGKDLFIDKLEREWDAIFLAIGGGTSAHLNIPGEEMEGVYYGLDLLRKAREGKKPDIGNSVIVIGGGNSAVDSALTCKRFGATDVSIICLEEKNEMAAFQTELEEAYEENIIVQNCWGPRKISRQDNGQLCVEMSRCLRLFDDVGNFSPTLENTCGFTPVADTVVIAIGQHLHKPDTPDDLFNQNAKRLIANPLTLQTNRHKVFAGGDALFGSQSVIEAMANGREAAISINRMFKEETLGWGRKYWDGAYISDFSIDHSSAVSRERRILPRTNIENRKLNFEVEKTMSSEDARKEAERCLNCGYPAEVNKTCWSCLPCEIECPVDALKVQMPYLIR